MSRYQVLIVEDSATMRELIMFSLRALSQLDFIQAENGAKALEAISSGKVDLILLDLNMPVMDGFEFLEKLLTDFGSDAPPVVVLTTKGDQESIMQAMATGARAYLTKPLETYEITETVKEALGL